ncbi:MAG: chemotaxis protein CheW [Syntrophus sp. (in: bacteria)]|nr:chemotaxis protein CheW [Syntrophus sp. (in: bacteria)]
MRGDLTESRQSKDDSPVTDGEDVKRILKERALRLAKEPEASAQSVPCLEVLSFMLAGERYAIEARCVTETMPLRNLTYLPGLPGFILGIANVRGRILSVMDIKKFFDLPDSGLTDLHKLIVVRHGTMEVGIVADGLLGIQEIPKDSLQPSLPTLTGVRENYLAGVTDTGTIVLQAEKILSDDRILVNDEG